eukprot:TRINITY_DN13863_c0_g1_i1.p1 TRINITY_DN13863_c0_g1~~TRINITY_DN13863_c0_g1_i1.p1  ORF type:complete len:421 (-),score=98.20 TRINITY_DN13863_c0_g1_i1:45-1307(-)
MIVKGIILFLFFTFAFSQYSNTFTTRILDASVYTEAKCLDGSPGGYALSLGEAQSNNWVFFFQGGGWCYEKNDCYGRSFSALGSSKFFAGQYFEGGTLSGNCEANPEFCSYNRVLFLYCDGMSFSGMRNEAVPVEGPNGKVDLYFRGRYILDAVIDDLSKNFNLSNAKQVLVSGCSAGGLSTFFQGDYIKSILPKTVEKYALAPLSGFFEQHENTLNQPVYPDQLAQIFELANATTDEECLRVFQHSKSQCAFAEHVYPFIESPIFVIDSSYDSWQIACILTSVPVPPGSFDNGRCYGVPGWLPCAQNPSTCDSTQIGTFNNYAKDMYTKISSAKTFEKHGNGVFIHSCFSHCLNSRNVKINDVSLPTALLDWWQSNFTEPAINNTFTDCMWNTQQPHNCNPSCNNLRYKLRLPEATFLP